MRNNVKSDSIRKSNNDCREVKIELREKWELVADDVAVELE